MEYSLIPGNESEVFMGKSQTEILLYWPSDSKVKTKRPKIFEIFLRLKKICLLYGILLAKDD